MRLLISCERRLQRLPDGTVWTSSSNAYRFWQRYLDTFEEVVVVVRVEETPLKAPNWLRVCGPGVSVLGLPSSVGLTQFLMARRRSRAIIEAELRSGDAVILRVPGVVGTLMEPTVRRLCPAYGAEVVGNPHDAFAPGSFRHPLRPLIGFLARRQLRRQCAGAAAVGYVTESTLQRLFPPAPGAYTTFYSSIDLPEDSLAVAPRTTFGQEGQNGRLRLASVGSMAMAYKGFDVLIEAVGRSLARGFDLELTLIGDGRYRPVLEAQARPLVERVRFVGELPGSEAVRAALANIDLFVLPSRSEGLPRVMIEAMAVGLPCLGTYVGGTPELLPAEDLVQPGDVAGLAARIEEVARDHDRLRRMSARNLETARRFVEPVLRERRTALYRHLREATQKPLGKRG